MVTKSVVTTNEGLLSTPPLPKGLLKVELTENARAVLERRYVRRKHDGKPAETVGENIDDASITAQVKAALLSHRSTGVLRTQVTTADGVVTLGGQARNSAEKDLVTKLVAPAAAAGGRPAVLCPFKPHAVSR